MHEEQLCQVITRPGVAGAVLLTPMSLINSLINGVSNPIPPDIQNTINLKPSKLGTWNFYTMFTTCHMSYITCHMSHLTSFFFYIKKHPSIQIVHNQAAHGTNLQYSVQPVFLGSQ